MGPCAAMEEHEYRQGPFRALFAMHDEALLRMVASARPVDLGDIGGGTGQPIDSVENRGGVVPDG